jgi:glycerol-3-phosphate O-acyltransferase/dihydroxyacetone phosphate acyltransferase
MNKVEPSLVGSLARRVARRLVKIYYPHIKLTGAALIPEAGPVLFCGNHPNSLVDPLVIGIASGRPVRFMAKAPLFKTPVLGPIMYGLGMIPTYRGSDDSKQVRRNLESLDSSIQFLVEGHAVGIFPEGKSHDAVQVEMVRSGVARIAVQVVERGASELVIVPLGLNYERKEQFRSSVWVQVGQPIEVEKWLQESGEEGRKAVRALTQEVEKRLKSVVVHLEEPGWEPVLEDLELLIQTGSPSNSLPLRKQIADAINYFLTADRPRAEAVAAELQEHRDAVQNCGLTMKSLVIQASGMRLLSKLLGRITGLLAGLLPALLGLVFHLVPFTLTRVIASRVTPRGRTAISLYRLLVGLAIYALWYVGAGLLAAGMNVSAWSIVLTLLLMPLAGVIALSYWPYAWQVATQFWRQLRLLGRREECRKLRQDRDSLRSRFLAMAEEYAQREDGDHA